MNRDEVLIHLKKERPLWTITDERPYQIEYPLKLSPIQGYLLNKSDDYYIRETSTGFLMADLSGQRGQVRHYFTSYESCRDVCIEWKKAQIKELEKDLAVLQGTEAPK